MAHSLSNKATSFQIWFFFPWEFELSFPDLESSIRDFYWKFMQRWGRSTPFWLLCVLMSFRNKQETPGGWRQRATVSIPRLSSCRLHSPKTPLVSTCIKLNKYHFIWLTLPLAIAGPVHIPETHAETCGSSSCEMEGPQFGSPQVKSPRVHGHYYH